MTFIGVQLLFALLFCVGYAAAQALGGDRTAFTTLVTVGGILFLSVVFLVFFMLRTRYRRWQALRNRTLNVIPTIDSSTNASTTTTTTTSSRESTQKPLRPALNNPPTYTTLPTAQDEADAEKASLAPPNVDSPGMSNLHRSSQIGIAI